ncbi:hypothetical protein ACTOB_004855 [Actinoplanes oblitus]|uniref:Uncharacterized protein n=1 Tax=Actinoplanes oblitus TaxID=3040509 RepID=A0ABY8W6C8_9ACTN|nr:hypothetical protein [Actinoplanes oblitus]WIM92897.1 hypothetical protein ACTOB_004855 [Actinoplanes oblitus]
MTLALIRADDHLVLGVRWSGFTLAGSGTSARLVAGAQARLVLLFPPQHIGEETSPPGSVGLPMPPEEGAAPVPTWRGVVSGPSRLAFTVPSGTRIPLTAEGLLAAVTDNPLLAAAGVPGPDDTAVELPWRLVITPRGRSGTVVCRHPAQAPPGANGLWRTRLLDSASAVRLPAAESAPPDAGLTIRVADQATAGAADPAFGPGNSVPLARSERLRLFAETAGTPARASRLELSALGGTLDAGGVFPGFEWAQRAVLGRDMHVRTLAKGAMYPFGHRAEFQQITERISDPSAGGADVLRSVRVLTIVEPVRRAPAEGAIRRAFPLGDVEITGTVFAELAPPVWQATELTGVGRVDTHFWPTTLTGEKVRFPVACDTGGGVVRFGLPMLFVADLRPAADSLGSPLLVRRLAADFPATEVRIAPTDIDLVGAAAERLPGDVLEVRSLTVAGVAEGLDLAQGYRSRLTELEVGLPALRALSGADPRARVAFAEPYLRNGPVEDVLLTMLPGQSVPIDFSKAADRAGGLVAPKYATNALSRSLGPIDRFALPDPATGLIDPARLFPSDEASLLGFPLRTLLTQLRLPPELTYTPLPGSAPEVRMRWEDVRLTSAGPFRAKPTTRLTLAVTTAPGRAETECVLTDVTLELPPGPKRVLRLSFAEMRFTQRDGKAPRLDVGGVSAEFLGDLTLLSRLSEAVDLGAAGKLIDVRPGGVSVRYSLPVPAVAAGAFVMRNMAFTAGIEVPFDGRPISVLLGFASRANPFQLAVMMFGGGGYVELALGKDGLTRFEAALEFGAFVAVDFVVAAGEVHALGGVRFVLERDGSVTVSGYLRIGGCVQVLGLMSVSIELVLSLAYRSERNALVGRATLVIEIDLTLWSDSVELDSGDWVLAGDDRPHLFADAGATDAAEHSPFELWQIYRKAYVRETDSAVAVARGLRNRAANGDDERGRHE